MYFVFPIYYDMLSEEKSVSIIIYSSPIGVKGLDNEPWQVADSLPFLPSLGRLLNLSWCWDLFGQTECDKDDAI